MDIYEKRKNEMKTRFCDMSDLAVREFTSGDERFCVIYISNYCSKEVISKRIIMPLLARETNSRPEDTITSASISTVDSAKKASEKLLEGSAILIWDGSDYFALTVAVKNEEGRSWSEPETENVIRGPHEGFTESGESNVMLLRRRLKTAELKKESLKIGEKSRTDVSLLYIHGVADEKIVAETRRRLKAIKIDGVTDSGTVEMYIQDGRYPLYATVGNSERPDKVAAKLLEGRCAIIVDGSPVVLTVPYLFCEGFQVTEDYSKSTWYASFIRLIRLGAFLLAIYLPALFVAFLSHHPDMLSREVIGGILSARENLPFSVFWEVVVVFLIFETVREVGLRMPKAVGAAVGLVGSLILGDSAIEAGIASAPVLIVVAFSAVCNFIVPPYMHPNILYRFFMIIISGALGLFGFFTGLLLGVVLLCGKTSFGVPYLYPIAPLDIAGLCDFPIMAPIWSMKKVPAAIAGKNLTRAGGKEK